MYELGQKEERAPYGRVEESLGARSSHTARRRPLILHTEEAEAPHATRFSNARQKTDLRIAEMSLRWIKQHH
jgi:hypothetical protein